MAAMRSAKERKRLERAQDEVMRHEWRGRWEWTLTFHDRITGTLHSLDIYRGQRRDQYDVLADSKPWRCGISATRLATAIRRKFTPHIL